VILPAFGTITGQVLGVDGNPVANASVGLVAQALSFQRYTASDAAGAFAFDHVPLGPSFLQASFADTNTRYASATVASTANGQELTVTHLTASERARSGTRRLVAADPLDVRRQEPRGLRDRGGLVAEPRRHPRHEITARRDACGRLRSSS
jgi:hypothetical protein